MVNTSDAIFDVRTEIGRDLAAVDWVATPLGPPASWPTSLRNVVRLQLASRFAMWMAWGPQLTFLCNESYRRSTLGAKYPWALGRPAREVWSEIWPDIAPRIQSVITTGAATWDESLLLFLERSGYPEETYHTFSYSPITDDHGGIAGMLCVVSEETARVISERRMATVRELGTALAAAGTVEDVNAAAGRRLARDGRNLPFALGYLFDEQQHAHLAWTAGVWDGHPIAPKTIAPDDARAAWPTAAVLAGGSTLVDDLSGRFDEVPRGAWDEPVQRALVVPLTQPGRPAPLGFLVAGLNRYRALDDDVRSFVELIAGQVAAAVSRAQAFEQERRRAEDLAELDRAKTTFFTNVSHELRTPLTLLLGPASDGLSDTAEPLPPAQLTRMEVIQRNGERLLKLVNTLLDFSRLESGRVEPRFEPLDLARYTAELAGMFESAMHRAGLELVLDCAPLPQQPYIDREMWAKIVLNLLSNALKATFSGSVTVRLGERDGAAELSVADTGVGIPVAEQTRLFERFHRVVGARLRSHEGSGIGLALVAELAALHAGTVSVQSTPGKGSVFTVRVPLGTDHLPPEQVHDEPVDELPAVEQYGVGYLAEADRWLANDDGTDPTYADGTPRPRVLVVDDNADMRNYVSGLLQDTYAVHTAIDGAQALELARADPPDLVLTDVMMPRLDGFGLLAELRADPATLHVPVVMLSARSGDEAAVVGLEAGADDYLVKPFSARELRARVRANLELDRVRRVAAELARSRTLLDQAEELAHVGSWEIELLDGRITASPEYLRIIGVSADELREGGLTRLLELLRPVDRQRFTAALERTSTTGDPFDLEVVLIGADGERILRANGVLQHSADGRTVLRGSVQDITDQRAAEQALAVSAAAREAAAREHQIAEELQRSLLPTGTPSTANLHVAAYYLSGVEDTQAGGDWYDVIELPGGRTALIVGDVMGRGVRAAAVMGQLRATVRAYARLDLPPERLLGLLDAAVCETTESMIVTCVYAVHDPRTSTLTYGNAGHLPPLVMPPGGSARRLVTGDPPLGTGRYAGHVETVDWPTGARIALYTDGLVEHRGSDIDVGIDELIRALESTCLPVEALPGELVDAVLPDQPDDDVAILVAEAGPSSAHGFVVPVPLRLTAVADGRRRTRAALEDAGVDPDVTGDVLVVVSELVTNAIRHGRAPIRLAVRLTGKEIVVEVSDGEHRQPRVRDFSTDAPSGRGLHMVDSFGAQWGVRPTGLGKSVWCAVPLTPAPPTS
jgi:PAS domain S-box-containing protein